MDDSTIGWIESWLIRAWLPRSYRSPSRKHPRESRSAIKGAMAARDILFANSWIWCDVIPADCEHLRGWLSTPLFMPNWLDQSDLVISLMPQPSSVEAMSASNLYITRLQALVFFVCGQALNMQISASPWVWWLVMMNKSLTTMTYTEWIITVYMISRILFVLYQYYIGQI